MAFNSTRFDDGSRLDTILLLDESSQRRLKGGLSEIISHGVKIINSLEEVNEEMLHDYHKVVLLEDYILKENSISNVRLFKEIFNIEFIYIGSDDLRLAEMSEVAECHKMEIANLGYAQIFGAVMKDTGLLNRYKLEPARLEDSAERIKNSLIAQGMFTQSTKELYDSFIVMINVLEDKNKIIASLNSYVQQLERANQTNTEQSDAAYSELIRIMKAEYERDKSLLQYEVLLSNDIYQKLSLANYTKRPMILYFKQYTKLNDFDKLILSLYNTLRMHKGLRCKALKLYGSHDAIELSLQPKYMKIIRNSFKYSDIEANDFLVKYGDYSKVLEILLNNKLEIDVLLLFDCKGNDDRVLNGADLSFDICQSKLDATALGLDVDLVITNEQDASPMTWCIDIEQLNCLNDRDSLAYLSSFPVIQNIINNVDNVREMDANSGGIY